MRVRRGAVALSLVAAGAVPVAAAPQAACAAGEPRAVLVVDTGAAEHWFCVALGGARVSGIDVIKLAGKQHGLDYSLGHGGAAVCRLAGVGPDGGDCFADYPDYWGYWRGDAGGGWAWSSTGAGSTSVEDGDVEGWSWGSGDSGSTHQAPPPTDFGEVCVPAAPPPRRTDTTRNDEPRAPAASSSPAGPQPSPEPSPSDVERAGDGSRRRSEKRAGTGRTERTGKGRRERAVVARARPDPASPAPPSTAARADDGPPAAALAALALTVAAAAAGVAAARRRGRGGER